MMKKILLIGDSTRQGYDKYVKIAFEGTAEVYYPGENCRFAAYIIRNLHEWKAQTGVQDDFDLIHWNAGLWDDLVMPDGEQLTPLPIYQYYVERICKMIALYFPKAKVIFATSTPIQEELFTICKRYNADTRAYNAAAIKIVTRYGAKVNDLYALCEGMPKSNYSDLAHLYTKNGTKLLTDQVISVIEKALDIKAKTLDYDMLFAEKTDAIGV